MMEIRQGLEATAKALDVLQDLGWRSSVSPDQMDPDGYLKRRPQKI